MTAMTFPADGVILEAYVEVPAHALGMVLFAHGSGSGRHSPRNRAVAAALRREGLGTVLADLLTPAEEHAEHAGAMRRFDIGLLARRLGGILDGMNAHPDLRGLPVGLFGASTGGGAALVAAADRPDIVRAVVSRGGRPDLAGDALPLVHAPTLLLVGGRDDVVLQLNRQAMLRMRAEVRLHVVPGATHLFEEPGALEEVALEAAAWFTRHLGFQGRPAT